MLSTEMTAGKTAPYNPKHKAKEMEIKITLIEELLGTASADPDIHREFIASKAPDAKSMEEEVEAIGVDAVEAKARTIFPKDGGKPFLWDYQIKGFFKDACGMLARVPGTQSNKLKAYRKIIDGLVFPQPRRIFLILPNGKALGDCQRPLRAHTAQGERIALAASETAPPGTTLECEIKLLDDRLEKVIEEWLNYGALRGLGQWRNSGKGRFVWKVE
jgi:hypothetical protein